MAGYDPRGARHYYNLYKKEAALQSKINGMTLDISRRKRTAPHIQSWKIEGHTDGEATQTNYHFLEWDDIIRSDWKKNFISLLLDLLYAVRIYIFSGLIFKYGKLSPTQMIAAFYPVVFVFAVLYLAYLAWYYSFEFSSAFIPFAIALIIAFVAVYIVLSLSMIIGNRLAVFWLLRIYVFSAEYVFKDLVDLESRIDEFATHLSNTIEKAVDNGVDEVLVVSHSVGTIIAIPIMSKAVKKADVPFSKMPHLSMVTLGECIPVVSFIKQANAYREHMKSLTYEKKLCWLDFTSAIDGACFPLLDFYRHSGIEVNKSQKPHYLSPRFHTLFSKKTYAKLRKNRYLTHFLYLMSTEIEGNYDFFKMTAGPKPLSSYIKRRKKI